MAVFSSRIPSKDSPSSLTTWLLTSCDRLGRQHSIVFDFDFSHEPESTSISHLLATKLSQILETACLSSKSKSTIQVGTYSTRRGTEIEIVTTSESTECDQSLNAFSKIATAVGNGVSLTTYRARCPLGGTAWIIVQSKFVALRMVA